jgi:hypothetical protein
MLDQLAAEVEAMAELDPDCLSDGELSELIVEGRTMRARLDGTMARLDAAWDARQCWAVDDAKSAAAWLSHRCRQPIGEARAAVRAARMLRHLDPVAEAFQAGEINSAHVRVLLSVINQRTAERFADDQKILLDAARTLDFDDFVQAVRYWHQHADPDGSEEGAEARKARRSFTMSESFDGLWFGSFTLTAIAGTIIANILRPIEAELFKTDWAEAKERLGRKPRVDELARTSQQRRADAFVEMAIRAGTAPAGGRRPAPLFTVHVDLATLIGRILELADGTVITPGEAAEHLDGADLERIIFDTPSRVIDLSHTNRLFLGALRRVIQVRDRHCTGFACRTPAEQCDIDHINPHSRGGETTQDNGAAYCGFHNRKKGDRRPPPSPTHEDGQDDESDEI